MHGPGRSPSSPPELREVDPNGCLAWQYDGARGTTKWFYDVDPLPNGNLLVVSPHGESTLVYELDRETRERVWEDRLPFADTHDVDRLDDGRLVVANMRAYDESTGESHDRVVVWNRSRDGAVSGRGPGPWPGTSRGPGTPTACRTATRSSSTASATASWR